MELSPQERQRFLEMLSEKALDDWKRQNGDILADITLVPVSTAAAMLGLNARQIRRILPIVHLSPKKLAVSVASIREAIAQRTRQPSAASCSPDAAEAHSP